MLDVPADLFDPPPKVGQQLCKYRYEAAAARA